MTNGNRDAQICQDYENWLSAKEKVGTVDDLATKWKISRQRLHKIVTRERVRREREAKSA
jgi:hypothetical protein